MTNLEKYLYQLRRIEEHRSKDAEKEIRKIYKQLLKEINSYLADIYLNYSEDDMLSFGNLAKVGMDARFLEEVEQRINGISPQVAKIINDTVTQSYEACYDGMRNAVVKAAGSRELLKTALSTVAVVTPEVIRAAVNNPVSGLTLKDTLEKHRKEIIYDIKRNIGVGLSNGDRFTTMAKRISQSLDSDYNKSIRIVRTEAHRIREAGFHDAATSIHETLQQGNSGYVMAKTWKTMDDERVRPNTVYKTKKGWKKGKKSKYNHEKMDGVTIPQGQEFEFPSGAKGKAPGQTGVAGEDINCRCYLSYDLVEVGVLRESKNGKKEMVDSNVADLTKIRMSQNSEIEWPPKGMVISSEQYKELRDYAEEKGIKLRGFKKSDVDIDLAREFIDDTAKMLDKYPELRGISKEFFTLELSHSMKQNDFAETNPGVIHIIKLNVDAMRSKTKLAEEYKKLADKGWFVKGTDYHSIIYHEMGHIRGDKYKIDGLQVAKRIFPNNNKEELRDYLEKNLSQYSVSQLDGSEIISEVFSAYSQGIKSEFVLKFIKICDILW